MTQDEFKDARLQLHALSRAVQTREETMRQAMAFYNARQYEWAMMYQFMFLEAQDMANELKGKLTGTDAHQLWFMLGGRP